MILKLDTGRVPAKTLALVEDCWEWGVGPTFANSGNDHGFINKKYISIDTRPFVEPQSKVMRAYAQSGQYHTIVGL